MAYTTHGKSYRDGLCEVLEKEFQERVAKDNDATGTISIAKSGRGQRVSVLHLLSTLYHVASDMGLVIPEQHQTGQFRVQAGDEIIIVQVQENESRFLLLFTQQHIHRSSAPA